jgi:phenylacetate-CoA ligase
MKKAFSKKNLWEKTPSLVKTTLGRCLGIFPPAWLLGAKFRANCKFVQKAQWWPAERTREYQLKKLLEIIKFAYEKTGFYRRLFDSVGFLPDDLHDLQDLSKLPVIDKHIVTENLAQMCTRSSLSKDVDFASTGGTSGTPLHFYINAGRSAIEYAYLTTSWQRAGYKLGMPMAVLRGRIVKPDRNGLRHEYDPILRHHYYSNFHMTDENIHLYLKHIRTIGPCILHAYPSSAHVIANYIIKTGQPVPQNIKSVFLESENVYQDQIIDIERAKIFSCYGHSEKLILAAQCERSTEYHVWPTYGYFELLDTDGKPVSRAGQEGEIVGTGFINTVVPFIRYRTGDYATYVNDRCHACGREHILITNIKGRWPQGWLVGIDGSVVSMTALNIHDDTFKNIREYQFHQSLPGKATLCVVPIITLDKDERNRIVNNMNKRLQGQVVLDLEIRTELVKTARGKQPRVIQNCVVDRPHAEA